MLIITGVVHHFGQDDKQMIVMCQNIFPLVIEKEMKSSIEDLYVRLYADVMTLCVQRAFLHVYQQEQAGPNTTV